MSDTDVDDDLHQIVRGLVERHHAELEKLRDENRHLKRENASLWESVHELQDMANRAHTEDAA